MFPPQREQNRPDTVPTTATSSTSTAHAGPIILDYAAVLTELTRCRLLTATERHELTVSELCRVLQL
ncbi:MAG: hypothetical protein AAF772_16590, partial [Acidobacteriota bacterium]